jgi:cytosine/adenosine deaminase-related metal-dependent hydrolase
VAAIAYLAAAGVGRIELAGDLHGPVTAADLAAGLLYRAADLGRRRVDALVARVADLNPDVHLAEGTDDPSREEFEDLAASDLLTPATVIIHGTALRQAHLERVRDAGASIVWSPQSNLRLYGDTTRAADALNLGIPLAIAADWQPSGSPSTLAELKVARRALAGQGLTVQPRAPRRMVTTGAARIAGSGPDRRAPGHVGGHRRPRAPPRRPVAERHRGAAGLGAVVTIGATSPTSTTW